MHNQCERRMQAIMHRQENTLHSIALSALQDYANLRERSSVEQTNLTNLTRRFNY
jgi:hypothetical protein